MKVGGSGGERLYDCSSADSGVGMFPYPIVKIVVGSSYDLSVGKLPTSRTEEEPRASFGQLPRL